MLYIDLFFFPIFTRSFRWELYILPRATLKEAKTLRFS